MKSSPAFVEDAPSERRAMLVTIGRVAARICVGSVFLLSAWFKATDYLTFSRDLWTGYQLPGWMVPLAFFLPPLEVAIGLALVLDFHARRAARWAVGALVLFSSMLMLGAWRGDLQSCGCGGEFLDAGPGMALLRNVGLVVVAGALGWWLPERPTRWPRAKAWVLAIVACMAAGMTGTTSHRPLVDHTSVKIGAPFPAELLDSSGVDVRQGRWVVFGFSASCADCWDFTHQIKSLVGSSDVSVVGVTASDEADVARWTEGMEPGFPVVRVDPSVFAAMQRELPTTWLVVDGMVVDEREHGAFAAPALSWQLGTDASR